MSRHVQRTQPNKLIALFLCLSAFTDGGIKKDAICQPEYRQMRDILELPRTQGVEGPEGRAAWLGHVVLEGASVPADDGQSVGYP
jgi:hypothetical protein